MKSSLKMMFSVLIASLILSSIAMAEIGTVYVKNTVSARLRVWVDGVYQGDVEPGATRYCVRDGFVSSNGSSVGGWSARGSVVCTIRIVTNQGVVASKVFTLNPSQGREASIAIGDMPVNDYDRENASPVLMR